MLTYENVLHIFQDYLEKDSKIEVLKSRLGYIRILYDGRKQCCDCELCNTPEDLFMFLISDYQIYEELQLTRGRRELNEEDETQVKALCQRYWKQWEEEMI